MSKKDFMRGVEAAVNAQKGFNEKQARATEEIAKRVVKKIDNLGNVVDVVIDQLNAQEKERLYSLKEQFDPKDLDETEKELVVSLIYTLGMQYEQNSQQQMDYYYNIRKYLEVTNPSADCDLSCVENIENVSEARGIYSIVCEFLFLKNGDHSYREEFSDFLDNFYVKPKDIRQVEEQINTKYEIMGMEDIVRHFDFGYDTFSVIEGDSGENVNCDEGGISYKNLENIKDISEKLSSLKLSELKLERSYTSAQEITRKKISISGMTSVTTVLTFKDCVFDTQKTAKLVLGSGADITFSDCCFEGENLALTTNGKVSGLNFIRCSFKNCTDLINVRQMDIEAMRVSECYILYPQHFFAFDLQSDTHDDRHSAEYVFDNNIFIIDKAKIKNSVLEFNSCYDKPVLRNNLFIGVEITPKFINKSLHSSVDIFSSIHGYNSSNDIVFWDCDMDMQNCTFYKLSQCVLSGHVSKSNLLKCEFIECTSPLKFKTTNVNVNDCAFIECSNKVINADSDIHISNCSFISCVGQILDGDTECTISNCEFKHIICRANDPLIYTHANQYSTDLYGTVEYCTFDDIELGDQYIAKCGGTKKCCHPTLYFKECMFSNIHTKRSDKKVIREYCEVGRFSSPVQTIEITSCTGINNPDNGQLSENKPVYSKTKGNGEIIGGNLRENYCEDFIKGIFERTVVNTSIDKKLEIIDKLIFEFLNNNENGRIRERYDDIMGGGEYLTRHYTSIAEIPHITSHRIEKALNSFMRNETEKKSEYIIGGYDIKERSQYDINDEALSGFLFCNDCFYYIGNFDDTPQKIAYKDINNVSEKSSLIITSSSGAEISMKYTKGAADLFKQIVRTFGK